MHNKDSTSVLMHLVLKLFLSFIVLLPKLALATGSDAIGVGFFNEPNGERYGAEVFITAKGDYIGGRLSGIFYASTGITSQSIRNTSQNDVYYYDERYTGNIEIKQQYAGLSAFAFIHAGQEINPYLGLGLLAGIPYRCALEEEYSEPCNEGSELSFFPEVGIEVNIMDVIITPYIRRYFDTSTSNRSGNVYGVNFSLYF